MPAAYKVLGQSNPSATTLTSLYTVPSATSAVVSTLAICNLSTSNATFRVAVRVNGAAITNSQYIVYDAALVASDSVFLTVGMSLAAGDIVSVYSSTANVAFSLYGSEIT